MAACGATRPERGWTSFLCCPHHGGILPPFVPQPPTAPEERGVLHRSGVGVRRGVPALPAVQPGGTAIRGAAGRDAVRSPQSGPRPLRQAGRSGADFRPEHLHRAADVPAGAGSEPEPVSGAQAGCGAAGALADPDVRITDAVYDAGYSGPARAYSNAPLGMRMQDFRNRGRNQEIGYTIGASPLGRVLVASTDRGLCAVILGSTDEDLLARLGQQFPAANLTARPELSATLDTVLSSLTEHPAALDLPLDLRATAFQMRVWEALRCIPRGETRTYSEIACAIGQPTAVRAVARACATNPVAVVIPCHRVMGSDGQLTGYRWGVERKRKLLEIERR